MLSWTKLLFVPAQLNDSMVKRVAAAVIKEGDNFLVVRRALGKTFEGSWEFPGGKIEAGESLGETIARELEEELKLTVVRLGDVLAAVEDREHQLEVHFVEVEVCGEPVLVEHDALSRLRLVELRSLSMPPADSMFVEQYLSSSSVANPYS